jgi:hypothetical protein
MAKCPTNELAAMTWLRTIPSLPTGKVSTRLPGNEAEIGNEGFITVLTVGGNSDIYVPRRSPVIEVKCWAGPVDGDKEPPWDIANGLAEEIREACLTHHEFGGILTTNSRYDNVCVPSAYFLSEPRKMEADSGRFGIYVFELQLHWTRSPT